MKQFRKCRKWISDRTDTEQTKIIPIRQQWAAIVRVCFASNTIETCVDQRRSNGCSYCYFA